MQQADTERLRILYNYVLVKPDKDYDFVSVGDDIKLKIAYNSETHGRHFGITGTVIKTPEQLLYLKNEVDVIKYGIGLIRTESEGIQISNMVNSSLSADVDNDLKEGDKIWFDYLCQINAVTDNLLVKTEHGICFLIRYDEIYAYQRDDNDVELINGWIWIRRIEKDKSLGGLELHYADNHKYQSGMAEVVRASKAVRSYIDGNTESQIYLKGGETVLYNHKMGFPMEYAAHRQLTDTEVLNIRRKDIYAVL